MIFWKLFFLFKSIRRRAIFYLKYNFFNEFSFEIPVGENLVAPIPYKDSYDSFSEIFLMSEYQELDIIDEVKYWLDLGCHMGYFSLWLEREKRKIGILDSKALLIDGDRRAKEGVDTLIKRNRLESDWSYIHGVISKPTENIGFSEKPFMSSQVVRNTESSIQLTVISESIILSHFDQKIDLIKVDIEGSEWDFLLEYPVVLKNCKYLLIEWHQWHSGGGGKEQIRCQLQEIGFEILKEIEDKKVYEKNQVGLILAKNHRSDQK